MASVNISLPPPESKGTTDEHTTRQTPPPQNNAPPPPPSGGQYSFPPGQNMPYNPQPMPQMPYGSQQQQQQQYYPQQQQPQFQQQMPQQQFQQQQMPYAQQMPPGQMMGQNFSPTPFLNVPVQVQPWTTGLFDCANDLENTIITFFCPCITFGQIAEITDRGMSTCMSAGLIYTLLLSFTGFHWIYSWMYRTRLRTLYSLQEDPFHDCLVHFFCEACALCQEYRELQNRGFNMQIGWIGNMQLQAQNGAATTNAPPPVQGMTR